MAKPFAAQLSEQRKQAFERLQIPATNRVILALDGGGMRGILTVQLLKKLEEVAGIPCHALFDMVSGTSTGAIIAGLIATGHTAAAIEKLYEDLVAEVFDRRFLGSRFLNPPAYSKEKYRGLLRNIIKDISLEEACRSTDVDMMITSKDMSAAEETFFSCFNQGDGSYYGTYKEVLLRAVLEATMSAPTYFHPLERFVDGGTTTYNNPSLAALMEAVSYSRADKDYTKSAYQMGHITLFSFGTGIARQFIQPDATINPKGIDIAFWLDWLMTEIGQDASAMQIDTLRSPMLQAFVDYRRFQISLDPPAIAKLPNTNALDPEKYGSVWLHDLDEHTLGNIDMADVTRFDLMQVIGRQMAEFIMSSGNGFTTDLVQRKGGRDILVSAFGDIERIRIQLKDKQWLDNFIP
jgi:hypothetical protein